MRWPFPILCSLFFVLCFTGCRPVNADPPRRKAAAKARVSGAIKFIEPSGKNIYLELSVDGKTVGVELFPRVAKRYKGKLRKGSRVTVSGKRLKGSKEIAYVVEVSDPAAVQLGRRQSCSGGEVTGGLLPLKSLMGKVPQYDVKMIAGYGLWPPVDHSEVKAKVALARADHAGMMVVDSGLTERWRAYKDPSAYYEIIAQAASAGKAAGLHQAYYLPTFELRREPGKSKTGLLKLAGAWAQVTLAGKPFAKTKFGKDEFWNKQGDEVLWVCPNSPWRKRFIEAARQAVKRGARTLFLDVPYFQLNGKHTTCRCKHCQKRFRRDTGLSIPRKVKPGDKAYHRWIWWRHQVVRGFLADLRRAMRKVSPRARLVVEEYPAYVDQATTNTGLDIGLAGAEVDAFAHEYSAKQFDKKPYSTQDRIKLLATLNLYRGLDGERPTRVLSYAHKAADSRVNAALHLAMDASFWETKSPEMNDTTVSRKWRRKLFGWYRKHGEVFGQSRQLAATAVLYSSASRDFSRHHFKQLVQVTRRLVQAGVPHRVMSTRDLKQAGRYSTLVLPAVECLGKPELAALAAAKKTRLLVVGRPPSKGGLGLKQKRFNLPHKTVQLQDLPAALGPALLKLSGGAAAANLLQRAGELQLRLASLSSRKAKVTVRLNPGRPVARASYLALLGQEKPLKLTRAGKTLTFTVPVKDLTVVRLKLK